MPNPLNLTDTIVQNIADATRPATENVQNFIHTALANTNTAYNDFMQLVPNTAQDLPNMDIDMTDTARSNDPSIQARPEGLLQRSNEEVHDTSQSPNPDAGRSSHPSIQARPEGLLQRSNGEGPDTPQSPNEDNERLRALLQTPEGNSHANVIPHLLERIGEMAPDLLRTLLAEIPELRARRLPVPDHDGGADSDSTASRESDNPVERRGHVNPNSTASQPAPPAVRAGEPHGQKKKEGAERRAATPAPASPPTESAPARRAGSRPGGSSRRAEQTSENSDSKADQSIPGNLLELWTDLV